MLMTDTKLRKPEHGDIKGLDKSDTLDVIFHLYVVEEWVPIYRYTQKNVDGMFQGNLFYFTNVDEEKIGYSCELV